MANNFRWTCPHCQHHQIVTDKNFDLSEHKLYVGELDIGMVAIRTMAISCVNDECKKLTLTVSLNSAKYVANDLALGEQLGVWRLKPESSAKPQPDYILEALRVDYYEACRIRDLSPKASATLARRCLQGMIRDFAKIVRPTLAQEIDALQKMVDDDKAPRGVTHESVEAIDHARRIGNIGAHMEKDINTIVDIDPDEAQVLIGLIETLFDEWYVAKRTREERFAGIAALRAKKDAEKKGS